MQARGRWAALGSVPSGSLVTDKGSSLLSLSAPAHPLRPPHAVPTSLGARAFRIISVFGWPGRSAHSLGSGPALELAQGDASLGSHTSSCAHWVLTCCSPVQTLCARVCMRVYRPMPE